MSFTDVVIRFTDAEDAKAFIKFAEKSKVEPGTPGALVCALASSAVRKADVAVLLGNVPGGLVPSRVLPAVAVSSVADQASPACD